MYKVINFFVGTTKSDGSGEVDINLWEEALAKKYGGFLRNTVTKCWHSDDGVMVYETQYCYRVTVMENTDYIYWDVFFNKLTLFQAQWEEWLDLPMIGLLIQNAE